MVAPTGTAGRSSAPLVATQVIISRAPRFQAALRPAACTISHCFRPGLARDGAGAELRVELITDTEGKHKLDHLGLSMRQTPRTIEEERVTRGRAFG